METESSAAASRIIRPVPARMTDRIMALIPVYFGKVEPVTYNNEQKVGFPLRFWRFHWLSITR
jgi:hypothetical protein